MRRRTKCKLHKYYRIVQGETKMKSLVITSCLVLNMLIFGVQCWADENALTASQILEKMDEVVNAPEDQELTVKLVLIDKNGREEVREMSMLQKGTNQRMVKFLSPAAQKGIAFLSLPDDSMYLYLPAFKKVRRIASHVKNTEFAGTDFTYEDMEAKRFSDKYNPELIKEEDKYYVLQLIPKEGIQTDNLKLLMWIRKDNFYPTRIEFFNKADNLYKTMTREKIEKVDGYWISKESEMEDLRAQHRTKMIITDVTFDSGLSDDRFTTRYLTR